MRFISRILIWMLPVLLLNMPAFAHHLWVSVDAGNYAVNRGIIADRTDSYDPALVENIRAWAEDGTPLSVERVNKTENVVFQTDAPAALTSVVCKWGDRVNTTRGKKLMSRKEAENAGLTVISSFFSTQFSKTLFMPADHNVKPLGLKFEIVPRQCPLSAQPGKPLSFNVLFNGEPLENVAVYTSDDRQFKTDKEGMVCISFEKNDVRMLYAKHRITDNIDSRFDYLKFMTFLNIEAK